MRAALLAIIALTAAAHTVSISRSELRVADGLARLDVRMPLTELDHMAQANRQLPRHFRIDGEGPISTSCRNEGLEYVCLSTFLAPKPSSVECFLADVTLPNHIHIMRVRRERDEIQLIFSAIVTQRELRSASISWWPLAAGGTVLIAAIVYFVRRARRSRGAASA